LLFEAGNRGNKRSRTRCQHQAIVGILLAGGRSYHTRFSIDVHDLRVQAEVDTSLSVPTERFEEQVVCCLSAKKLREMNSVVGGKAFFTERRDMHSHCAVSAGECVADLVPHHSVSNDDNAVSAYSSGC